MNNLHIGAKVGELVKWDNVGWVVLKNAQVAQYVLLRRAPADGDDKTEQYQIQVSYETITAGTTAGKFDDVLNSFLDRRKREFEEQAQEILKNSSVPVGSAEQAIKKLMEDMGIKGNFEWDKISGAASSLPPHHPNARSEIAAIKGKEDLDQKFKAYAGTGYNVLWVESLELFETYSVEQVEDLDAAWAFVDYLNDDEAGKPIAIRQDNEVLYEHHTTDSWQRSSRCNEPIPAAHAPARPKPAQPTKPGVYVNFVDSGGVRGTQAHQTIYDEILSVVGNSDLALADLKKMLGL